MKKIERPFLQNQSILVKKIQSFSVTMMSADNLCQVIYKVFEKEYENNHQKDGGKKIKQGVVEKQNVVEEDLFAIRERDKKKTKALDNQEKESMGEVLKINNQKGLVFSRLDETIWYRLVKRKYKRYVQKVDFFFFSSDKMIRKASAGKIGSAINGNVFLFDLLRHCQVKGHRVAFLGFSAKEEFAMRNNFRRNLQNDEKKKLQFFFLDLQSVYSHKKEDLNLFLKKTYPNLIIGTKEGLDLIGEEEKSYINVFFWIDPILKDFLTIPQTRTYSLLDKKYSYSGLKDMTGMDDLFSRGRNRTLNRVYRPRGKWKSKMIHILLFPLRAIKFLIVLLFNIFLLPLKLISLFGKLILFIRLQFFLNRLAKTV